MKKIALVCFMIFAALGGAFAQSDLQPLAIVKLNKSESITVKQVKARVSPYEKQLGRKLTVEERKEVLNTIIKEKLMLQAAQKDGVSIPDSAVDQYFIQGMSQQLGVNVSEKELDDIVRQTQGVSLDELLQKQVGMNTSEYKQTLKNQLMLQQYVLKSKQAEIQAVAPTDDEIRAFYDSNKASFVWNDMMKAFLVIVAKGDNADAARNKANSFRNQLVDNKITKDQLIAQSKQENSGFQAGELLISKTEPNAQRLGYSFEDLRNLFNQKDGFVTDIKETSQDFRFMKFGKKYEAKMLGISDVVQPDTTVTVYDYIRGNLAQQKQMQYVQYAAQQLADSLNTPENVEMKKKDAALDKLLAWEN